MAEPTADTLELLRRSGLFDEKFYLGTYPDVARFGLDPIAHYLWIGARLGRDPSPQFSTLGYLQLNSDVSRLGINPLLHYVTVGRAEGREAPRAQGTGAGSVPDLNSSTYHATRPYDFATSRQLYDLGANYLATRTATPRVVVYSAVSGGYDTVLFHEHLMPDTQYVLFTDAALPDPYIFDQRPLPYVDEDPVRSARFVKLHPHMLLTDADVAIWVDGNVMIRGDVSASIASFRASGQPVAAVPHPLRTSPFEDARECIKRGKDDSGVIEAQMQRYTARGFASEALAETNFMMFRLDHPQLAPTLAAWWRELEAGSRRDQLSLNFALREAGASYYPLTTRPNSVRNHPDLAHFHHGTNRHTRRPGLPVTPPTPRTYSDVMDERLARLRGRQVDVVVCVHNALDVVMPCLESVAKHRSVVDHRIVIVDDGSNAETAAWLSDFATRHANVHLIRHDTAIGYTRAANVGLRAMAGEFVILLNSDTVVAGPWIAKLLDAAVSHPGVGIVGPLSSAASHQSIPQHRSANNQTAINDLPPGYSVADLNHWCEVHTPADRLPRVPLVHGFCFGVTRTLIDKVGYLDEVNFPHGYGEENDYCLRAVDHGFSLVIATHTYVFHVKSQSYQSDRRVALMQAGNMKIRELHGKERVLRSVRSMQGHPELVRLRELALTLYPEVTLDAEA
ncbi:MAG: glycosyl transferase, family 2 [Devosia sp.]|nr:glycosyl transferase, family 2 [Devosia sp.]